MRALALVLLLACAPALAQMPKVEKLSRSWFNDKVEFELRMRGTNSKGSPYTVRVVKLRFSNINARYYVHIEPCWNKVSACPAVNAVTIRAYLTLPWLPRTNITKFLLCNASECLLEPWAIPIQAKPNEGYRFDYDRVAGLWRTVPSVVALP